MKKNDEILTALQKTKEKREEKTLTVSTRLDKDTNELILLVATIEDRTVSKVLQRLIERGLKQYFNETDNLKEYFDFLDSLKYGDNEENSLNESEAREKKQKASLLATNLEFYIRRLRD